MSPAWLPDEDRTGHDVHAGPAVGHRYVAKQALYWLIHHQLRRIAGVVRDGLGPDQIAAAHAQRRGERGIEISQ